MACVLELLIRLLLVLRKPATFRFRPEVFIMWFVYTLHFLELQWTNFEWMLCSTATFHAMTWNHPLEATIYKRKFQVPGLDEVILHFNQSICVWRRSSSPSQNVVVKSCRLWARETAHAKGHKKTAVWSETPCQVTLTREVSFGQFRTGVSPFVLLEMFGASCVVSS